MSTTAPGKKHLILVVGDAAAQDVPAAVKDGAHVVTLTESTAREVLEAIFAAETVAVWGCSR